MDVYYRNPSDPTRVGMVGAVPGPCMCVRLGWGTGCDKQLNNPAMKRESTQSVPCKQSKSHCNGEGIGCTIKTAFFLSQSAGSVLGLTCRLTLSGSRRKNLLRVCEVSALNSFDALLLPQVIEETSQSEQI